MKGASALATLTEATGRPFPSLGAAREYRDGELEERRTRFSQLGGDEDVAVVLMGSWGRAELTEHSDDDFMVLAVGEHRATVEPSVDAVEGVLGRAPSAGRA